MTISKLAQEIKESPTLTLNATAGRLREKGEPVIHLGAGEPKSKVPLDAILAAAAKLTTADIRYTPTEGIPSLIKAVIKYTADNYQRMVGPKNVIISNGAKHAIYNLMVTLVDPKDEVIILAPYWVSYPEIVKMVYGVPVIVDPEPGSFLPKMENIAKAVTPRTKVIMVNSPNNPSGAIYPEGLIAEIVQFCEKKGIYLMMDDIYHKLTFDKQTTVSCYKFAKDNVESSKLIVINGVSKMYAMTGFRIGWTIANEKIIEAMINVQAQNTSCSSVVLQEAAAGALKGVQSGVENLRLTLENNRNIMVNELRSFSGVKIIPPDGTFYCLPDFSAYNNDSLALSKFLLEKALVVTVPGKEFGLEGHLRLSYCGSVKEITEGIARIKWALDPKSPSEIFVGDKRYRRDWK
ncbi:MAG: aminotransferase class I/II-fold pyridoxal phosphate-dependent enzyme [candidate division Zixibacteria bacterium]|nr:aminotransferase class I/II-fold pyridoxal phosphate-dependent enzyme [candidate division Zixibacteria bacterium]